MSQRNAYFRIHVREEGTFLQIFPALAGGKALEVGEVTAYLEKCGCKEFNIKELNQALLAPEGKEVLVGNIYPLQINEEMSIRISLDKMNAYCRFYPGSEGGNQMTVKEILSDLTFKGITNGIRQEEILHFMNDREYCTDYVFAMGKMPVHGRDAKVEYFFNTNLNLKPKRNEDGSVDYRELNVISHVEAGALLARLIKEDPGRPGSDIFGKEVPPRTVKKLKLQYGNHIRLSEDGSEIYSEVTGHASLVNDKVFVSDVYEVPADVDNSTGNINYPGNVTIKGNVKGGFSVVAKGDVVVDGVVENAVIQAGGQIIVKRGIHGMTKGVLKAAGNIMCKFIENATVISGGYVETDSILHSRVSAATEVHVKGKNGFITGGVIQAGNLVEAQTIGSDMGAATRIEVGVEPEKKARFVELQQFIQQENKAIAQIKPILATYSEKLANGETLNKEAIQYVEQLANAMRAKQEEVESVQDEYAQLHTLLLHNSNARVQVKKTIYSGVTVCISEISITLKENRDYCQLTRNQGEILISTM
ncbi:MAG: DUF342 domain-containing protein [Roseburia sp.]